MSNTTAVDVFLGHPLVDLTEKHFLARLRRELLQRGVRVRILANLQVGVRHFRELDFVIVTDDRAVVCELKGYRNPVVARRNGRWKTLVKGASLELDGNPYRQVQDGGYALSDAMRDFARASGAPGPTKDRFVKDLDLVVCLFPSVPAGSDVERHPWVEVVGYEELVARIDRPGRRPTWSDEHWDAFVRHLALYRDEDDDAAARARRVSVAAVDAYCARFVNARQTELPVLVPTHVLVDGEAAPRPDLRAKLVDGSDVLVHGGSGQGKTLWASHTAVEMASAGHVPIWLAARAYEGDFATHLARAVAPYTTLSASQLIAAARAAGRSVLLVVDGLNECPVSARLSLIEGVQAVRLRALSHSVLITAQRRQDLPAGLSPISVELLLPDDDERRAILAVCGAEHILPALDCFDTPLDLTIAAASADVLGDQVSPVELVDGYVDRVTDGETTRAILRSIAWRMHQELRWSLRTPDVVRGIRRELRASTAEIDRALACRLLVVAQGRASFLHERYAQFLAAEALVLRCEDGCAVARVLNEPRSAPIRGDVVGLERDEDQLRVILANVEDHDLLVATAEGRFGDFARRIALAVLVEALRVASTRTASPATRFVPNAAGATLDAWELPCSLTPTDVAQLTAAGRCLRRGLLIDEAAQLIMQTDALCAAYEAGEDDRPKVEPGRTFVATYASGRLGYGSGLPVTVVARGCVEEYHRGHRSDTSGAARALVERGGSLSPGVLYVAINLLQPFASGGLDLLPRVTAAGLASPANHLRLETLQLIEQCGRRSDLDPDIHEAMLEAVRAVETNNIFLSSAVVEALASLGGIEPVSTLERIAAELNGILSRPDDPLAWRQARGAISSQFEEQEIVGPYCEAIEGLDEHERRLLFAMALRASEPDDLYTHWILEQLEDLDDPRARAAVAEMLSGVDPTRWHSTQWGIASTLRALLLFAKAGGVPCPATPATEEETAWQVFVDVLDGLLRRAGSEAELPDAVRESCRLLLTEHRAYVADLLYHLHSARGVMWHDDRDHEKQLIDALGPQCVEVLLWSLEHPEQLRSPFIFRWEHERSRYIVELLGRLGEARTADTLRALADDPRLGQAAVQAVRAIEARR